MMVRRVTVNTCISGVAREMNKRGCHMLIAKDWVERVSKVSLAVHWDRGPISCNS